jgi:twinkle protein
MAVKYAHQAADIARTLAERAEDVARHLLPNGKRSGQEWRVGSTAGESGESLGVRLTGDRAGLWSDFATGDSGDLLDLWAAVKRIGISEALGEARGYLGIREPTFEGHRPKTYQRPKRAYESATAGPVFDYLTRERGLSPETLGAYRVGQQGSEIVFPSWRGEELVFVKYLGLKRPNGKKQIRVEPRAEPCLFGWQAIPPSARTVAITEGEIDAMSLHQLGVPALSVPFGGGAGHKQDWVENEFTHLQRFDTIFLCLDRDTDGESATAELISRLGHHRCRIVEIPAPHKDGNDLLGAGWTPDELARLLTNARTMDPEELKPASSFVEQVISEFYPPGGKPPGAEPPWATAAGKIRFRRSELSIWTGINGHGKSQLLGQVLLSLIAQAERVCIASLEIPPRRLLWRLTRQATALEKPSLPYIRAVHEWFSDRLWIFDVLGNTKAERLLEVFGYARRRYGIRQFMIDSLLKCGIAEDDYAGQKRFVEALADFKNETDSHVYLVAHARKGEDEERLPGKLDVKGTGSITDLADSTFSVWRNKKREEVIAMSELAGQSVPEDILVKPSAILRCDKQRNGDWEGKLPLWFDQSSYQFLAARMQRAHRYVEFQAPSAGRHEA